MANAMGMDPAVHFLLDTVAACKEAVHRLWYNRMLAVDLEGASLYRGGTLCIVSVKAESGPAHLFDISALGPSAFYEGHLRYLLEAPHVFKLMFDARADADILYHQYGTRLRNVLDLQVLFCNATATGMSTFEYEYLPGASAVVAKCAMHPWVKEWVAKVKDHGHQQMQDKEIWRRRPIKASLLVYAAYDVALFFTVFRQFQHGMDLYHGEHITKRRIDQTLEGEASPAPEQQKRRDFPLDRELRQVYVTNLPSSMSWEIQRYFNTFGAVVDVTYSDEQTSVVVEFAEIPGALRAIACDQHDCEGCNLSVACPDRIQNMFAHYNSSSSTSVNFSPECALRSPAERHLGKLLFMLAEKSAHRNGIHGVPLDDISKEFNREYNKSLKDLLIVCGYADAKQALRRVPDLRLDTDDHGSVIVLVNSSSTSTSETKFKGSHENPSNGSFDVSGRVESLDGHSTASPSSPAMSFVDPVNTSSEQGSLQLEAAAVEDNDFGQQNPFLYQ